MKNGVMGKEKKWSGQGVGGEEGVVTAFDCLD